MAKVKSKGKKEPTPESEFEFSKKIDGQTKGLMNEIFTDESGAKPDLTKLERKTRSWKRIALVGLIVFLFLAFGLSLLGVLYFNRKNTFKEEKVGFSYTGVTQAISGDVFTLRLRLRNQGAVALTRPVIEISYPEGFSYLSANYGPAGQYHNQWQFPDLLPGHETTLEVSSQIVAEIGESKKFAARLTYQPANFTSEFEKRIDWEIVITASSLDVELKGSREVMASREIAYQLQFRNTSTRDMSQLKITPVWPSDFVLKNSNPERDTTDSWLVATLSAGEQKTIEFTGVFTGPAGAQQELRFTFALIQADGSANLQTEPSFLILLIEPQLQLTVTLNEETEHQAVKWGDVLKYAVRIDNAGELMVGQGKLTLALSSFSEGAELEADYLDWSTLVNSDKARQDGKALIWEASDVAGLTEIKPGDSVEARAEASLLNRPPEILAGKKNFEVRAKATFTGKRADEESDAAATLDVSSETLSALILSQPTLEVSARYYNEAGEPIGLGPFPPVVGQSTTFKIFWTLKNTSNDLTSVTVKTTLPEFVSWVGQGTVSAGEPLSFDNRDRSITWKLNRLPARIGQSTLAVSAEFSVSLTPVRSQLNEYALLIDKTTFKATDSFSQDTLTLSQDGESTSLTDDPVGRGKGKVIGQGS